MIDDRKVAHLGAQVQVATEGVRACVRVCLCGCMYDLRAEVQVANEGVCARVSVCARARM